MMKREETFFLSILADHLNGRLTKPVSGLNWAVLHAIARKQNFGAIVYAQCGEFMPPEIEASFLEDYSATVNDYARWQVFLPELEHAFTRENIPFVPFKGVEVAACYPQPDLRKWADLDMLVPPEAFEKADALLRNLGFANTERVDLHWTYAKGRLTVELHRYLLPDPRFWNVAAANCVMERVWAFTERKRGSVRCQLTREFHFAFLLAHAKKHFLYPGITIRQLADLAAVAQKWTLDGKKVESLLEEAALGGFAQRCFALCERWFEVKMPIPATHDSAFEQEVVRQTFGGVKPPAPWKCDVFVEGNHHAGTLRSYFPTYDTLRQNDRYKFVDNRPWLVPIAWLYRILAVPYRMVFSAYSVRRRDKWISSLEKWG